LTREQLEASLALWERREAAAHRNHQSAAKRGDTKWESTWIQRERDAEILVARRRKQLADAGGSKPPMFTSTSLGLSFQWVWGSKGTPFRVAGHYTAGARSKDMAALKHEMVKDHAFHKGKGWGGVSYECMIADDGTIGLGNPMGRLSAAVASNNTGMVSICCPGTTGDRMTAAQVESAKWYLNNAHTTAVPPAYRSPTDLSKLPLRGHKEYPGQSTACPGDMLPQYHMIARTTS
jgi:hypothetical protein